jgi:large subunit ribosomal protein L29
MKASKFRDQTIDELKLEEARLKEQIFRLRFQFAVGQAENPMRIRLARRDLARVQTVLTEKQRDAGAQVRAGRG